MENLSDFRGGRRAGAIIMLVNTIGVGFTSFLIGSVSGWLVYELCSKPLVKKPAKYLEGGLRWAKIFGNVQASTIVIVSLIILVILLLVFGLFELSDLKNEINKNSNSAWGGGFGSGGF